LYTIGLEPIVEQQVDELPAEALPHYLELRAFLELTPWSGAPFRRSNPEGNMREKLFGGGRGLAVYVVLEERRMVYIVRITWLG
jgi:hypothetical protein